MAVLTGLPKSRLGLACVVAFAVFVSVGSARWLGWLEVPGFALYTATCEQHQNRKLLNRRSPS